MEKNTRQFVHYAGALFLTVATIAVVWQMFGPSWFKNIKAEVTNQPYARTITVNGEGKVITKPDIAVASFSVVTEGKTVKEVTDGGNKKMNEVLEALKKMNIASNDLVTTQYSLQPKYNNIPESLRYGLSPSAVLDQPLSAESLNTAEGAAKPLVIVPSTVQTIVGYTLNQTVQVKVRKLEEVDQIIDTAVKAGSNQIGQLYFDIDDSSKVEADARKMAFEEARKKADEMSGAAGVKLGRVVTFSEGYGYQPYRPMEMSALKMDAASAPPSIEPGSKEVILHVSVTYEIE